MQKIIKGLLGRCIAKSTLRRGKEAFNWDQLRHGRMVLPPCLRNTPNFAARYRERKVMHEEDREACPIHK
tara:strand:+ start:186 stop:395 length:210 start_codon:yes stop_codon:yes gene_type:complete